MSSRPPARGRDTGVVAGDGAGTSRLRRVLAVGTVGCAHEGATCREMEGRDLLEESAFRRLTLTLVKLRECDRLPKSATKEKERGEAWAAVERAANGLPAHMLRHGCVPDCVKRAVERACVRAFAGNASAAEHYYDLALAYLERRARERAASAGTVGRVLPEPTHTPADTRVTHSLRRLSLENDMHVGAPGKRPNPVAEARNEAKRACSEFNDYGLREGQSGVTVIPFMDKATREREREKLRAYFDSMPEYKNGYVDRVEQGGQMPRPYAKCEEQFEPDPETFAKGSSLSPSTFDNDEFAPVEGGFAGMGNPSSYHNRFVRDLRMAAHVAVVESGVVPVEENENLEQEACRLMVRRSYKTPTAETWHRDEAIFAKDGDTIYGGWVNLDLERDQLFSMVP